MELPLANTKGPVETTGTACKLSDNGSGNGDSDGSGNTPDEGGAGTKPIDGWLNFEPVVGDATGTSVSGAVAKLNKNLGVALRQVVDSTKQDSNNINSITHSAEAVSRDMKEALYHIKQSSSELSHVNGNLGGVASALGAARDYLQSIDVKLNNLGSGSSGGGSSSVASDVAGISAMMGASLGMMSSLQGNTNGLNNKLDDISGNTRATSYFAKDMKVSLENIERSLGGGSGGGSSAWTRDDIEFLSSKLNNQDMVPSYLSTIETASLQQNEILGDILGATRDQKGVLEGIASALDNGGGDGKGVDYTKMPGSDSNPLAVKRAQYDTKCEGGDCFFDIAAIQKKLDDANKAISDKYKNIGDEVKEMFDFQLSGSAGIIECFDFFTYGGKDYRVCPPAKEYWDIIAALMMFIFYFIAFAIVFKR
ncbi:hypothetical protein ACTG2T_20380 [Aeromonas sp. 75A]|uniref:hypothetical protein n=1 Tax=unclassified Aeromonas TaxID=257493 RepID=UPI002E7BDB51|nr:hypothetical protein [Aeromonas sp. 43P]MEE1952236.1 hypothetical protein [Aeromonas sp. 43P]